MFISADVDGTRTSLLNVFFCSSDFLDDLKIYVVAFFKDQKWTNPFYSYDLTKGNALGTRLTFHRRKMFVCALAIHICENFIFHCVTLLRNAIYESENSKS